MKRTEEQEAIVNFAINNLLISFIVDALAGTGKTTVLEMVTEALSRLIPKRRIAAFCFNKEAAENLKKKLGDAVFSSTYHAYCYKILRRKGKFELPKKGKFQKGWLAYELDNIDRLKFKEDRERNDVSQDRKAIQDLIHFIRVTLTNMNDLSAISEMARFRGLNLGFEIDNNIETASLILREHVKQLERDGAGLIDFDDMVFLPVHWNLEFDKFDDVLVDEAQDTNAVAKEAYARSVADDGRMIIVGDPGQAIYAFTGADNDSMIQLQNRFNAVSLPLTMNWRCGKNIIKEAQKLVPAIRASDNAIDGVVAEVGKGFFNQNCKLGDMVICRRNAPLAPICIKLIKEEKKAYIKGRDIGAEITKVIDTAIKAVKKTGGDFERCLTAWAEEEEDRLRARKMNVNVIDTLWDKIEVIRHFSSDGMPPDIIKVKIQAIFKDEGEGIVLSSVHKQKGGQAVTVWIIDIDNIRIRRPNMTQADCEQEEHLEYVAKTRAKEFMYYVNLQLPDDACISLYPSEPEDKLNIQFNNKPKSFLEAIGAIK